MTEKTAFIGMSGGVDSSVAALLTQKQGYRCAGATMVLHSHGCSGEESIADARAVAERLGIPFHVLDFQEAFEKSVIRNFVTCYEAGSTPNPCIECNRNLKFREMLHAAMALGYDKVVTGHYAQIRQDPETGRYLLYKAVDTAKDQTYFLASLDQFQLSHTLFPLGGLTKAEVRAIAEENGFINAGKRDSQDICFIPDGDYAAFLARYTGKTYPAGDYLDLYGNVVGKHRGAVSYTLGQRKGLGIALGAPVYVCAKDMEKNTVTVGPNEALFSPALLANNWNWFPFDELTAPMPVTAKIRHSQFEKAATVYPEGNGSARVVFDEPQRAVTPGQAVVLYQGDMVFGGGTIIKAL